jgi:hypothetical protein
MSSQRRKLTENAQTADVHGPGPRPAVELPILRLNASLNRRWPAGLVSQSTVCRRYVQMLGISLVFCCDRRLPGVIPAWMGSLALTSQISVPRNTVDRRTKLVRTHAVILADWTSTFGRSS